MDYNLEEYGARVDNISSGNEYYLKIKVWPYFTAGGLIQFRGELDCGTVTLYSVIGKSTRLEVKEKISSFIHELVIALEILNSTNKGLE